MNHVLYLVRHCQATGQEPDAPLTETGQQQAMALADWLGETQITRIISSSYVRAYQSVISLAKRLGLTIEVDDRPIERVLCSTPLNDWREKLAETFVDLDLIPLSLTYRGSVASAELPSQFFTLPKQWDACL